MKYYIIDLVSYVISFWVVIWAFIFLNIPVPGTKTYCQNNIEQCQTWISEAKND